MIQGSKQFGGFQIDRKWKAICCQIVPQYWGCKSGLFKKTRFEVPLVFDISVVARIEFRASLSWSHKNAACLPSASARAPQHQVSGAWLDGLGTVSSVPGLGAQTGLQWSNLRFGVAEQAESVLNCMVDKCRSLPESRLRASGMSSWLKAR